MDPRILHVEGSESGRPAGCPSSPDSSPEPPGHKSLKRRAPKTRAAYPRKRVNMACQVCRARRTKCDNKKPSCSFCEKVGAKCIFAPVEASNFDPASQRILERLDDLERLVIKTCPRQELECAPPSSPSSVGGERRASSREAALARPYDYRVEHILAWSVFRGEFSDHLNLRKILTQTHRGDAFELPSPSMDPGFSIDEPQLGSINVLLDNFMEYVHVKNPVLDENDIRRYVHRVCFEGIGWDAESCLVLLICALGSIASSFGGSASMSISFQRAQQFFHASQKRIGSLLYHSGVLEAQCFFYSGVYMMSLLQPLKAWRLFVQALACCQEFDIADGIRDRELHVRSPPTPEPTASPLSVKERARRCAEERIYWTCWKSEFEIRHELQLSNFKSSDLSYPSAFPTPPETTDEDRAWYFYLAEIALRRLRNSAVDQLCCTQQPPQVLAEEAAVFEEQGLEWTRSLPAIISLQTPESSDDVLKFILRGHLLNCYENIYSPFIHLAINSNVVLESFVRKGLDTCTETIRINRPGFTHRHHGTWLMLRACTRSALILLAAARTPATIPLLPKSWDTSITDVRDMLTYWAPEVADAADRLRIIERLLVEIVN